MAKRLKAVNKIFQFCLNWQGCFRDIFNFFFNIFPYPVGYTVSLVSKFDGINSTCSISVINHRIRPIE